MDADIEKYKKQVLETIILEIENRSEVLAAWEAGSAATGTGDQYSDIDICILAKAPIQKVIENVQNCLQKFQVIHTWQPIKSVWGEGIVQRIMVLKDSPKYFFVDVDVFDYAYPKMLQSFLEIERHGHAKIIFDKVGALQSTHVDAEALFHKQQARVEELSDGFIVFKTLVLKEITRGHPIDAFGFYQNALVRPLIEVLGMLYRPFRYDFGMRYIHKTFPPHEQKLIEELNYVIDVPDLLVKVERTEKHFFEAVLKVKKRTSL